jgi:ABC-type transport system involved in multi-copper enzyme maturation permease subunit
MPHGLLTLFNRSVRLDARGVKGHAFRIAFALFIYFALLNAYLTSLSFGAPGLRFFSAICYINLFFIALAGMSFFATAVTEEKEEGTLGLLKMANMSRGAILLGKSTSRLLSSVLLLVIQFPFLLLAITLGGVLYGQVAAAAVTLISFLAFAANVALLFSVICKRSGSAVAFTVIALLGRFLLPPLLAAKLATATGLPSYLDWLPGFARWFEKTSPWQRLDAIMTTGFSEPLFSPQVVFDLVASVACFALAWLLFDKFTENERAGDPSRGLVFRRTGRLRWFSAGRVWNSPLVWKDFHFLAGGWSMLLLKTVAYALIAVAIGAYIFFDAGGYGGPLVLVQRTGFAVFWAMLIAAAIELAVTASRLFHDEWKWKTLDALLLLPRPISRLAWAKATGALFGLVPALVFLLAGVLVSGDAAEVFGEAVKPIGWAVLLGYVVFLHVTALMSLFVKWGSLPLAFLVCAVASYALTPVLVLAVAFAAAFDSEQAAAVPICGLFLGLIAVLQLLIAKRLEVLGGR